MHSLKLGIPAGRFVTAALFLFSAAACSGFEDDEGDDGAPAWQIVQQGLPGALLSVWGTGADDVWVVGADARDGSGPLVFHYDGSGWERMETGQTAGTLWWVFGFEGGPVLMGGAGGIILRYDGSDFTLMDTPGTGTVWGIWGSSPNDLWAVGGESPSAGGFAWRNDGGNAWTAEPTLPATVAAGAAVWKLFGTSRDNAWLVGSDGVVLRWDGRSLTEQEPLVGESLFTIHGRDGLYAAVGGTGASGYIFENDGGGWEEASPAAGTLQSLAGIFLEENGSGYAVGKLGSVYHRTSAGWTEEDLDVSVNENFHAVWIDPSGGVWAAGGFTDGFPLTRGVLVHEGEPVPSEGM